MADVRADIPRTYGGQPRLIITDEMMLRNGPVDLERPPRTRSPRTSNFGDSRPASATVSSVVESVTPALIPAHRLALKEYLDQTLKDMNAVGCLSEKANSARARSMVFAEYRLLQERAVLEQDSRPERGSRPESPRTPVWTPRPRKTIGRPASGKGGTKGQAGVMEARSGAGLEARLDHHVATLAQTRALEAARVRRAARKAELLREARESGAASPSGSLDARIEKMLDLEELVEGAGLGDLSDFEKKLYGAFCRADVDKSGVVSRREWNAILDQVRALAQPRPPLALPSPSLHPPLAPPLPGAAAATPRRGDGGHRGVEDKARAARRAGPP